MVCTFFSSKCEHILRKHKHLITWRNENTSELLPKSISRARRNISSSSSSSLLHLIQVGVTSLQANQWAQHTSLHGLYQVMGSTFALRKSLRRWVWCSLQIGAYRLEKGCIVSNHKRMCWGLTLAFIVPLASSVFWLRLTGDAGVIANHLHHRLVT